MVVADYAAMCLGRVACKRSVSFLQSEDQVVTSVLNLVIAACCSCAKTSAQLKKLGVPSFFLTRLILNCCVKIELVEFMKTVLVSHICSFQK